MDKFIFPDCLPLCSDVIFGTHATTATVVVVERATNGTRPDDPIHLHLVVPVAFRIELQFHCNNYQQDET